MNQLKQNLRLLHNTPCIRLPVHIVIILFKEDAELQGDHYCALVSDFLLLDVSIKSPLSHRHALFSKYVFRIIESQKYSTLEQPQWYRCVGFASLLRISQLERPFVMQAVWPVTLEIVWVHLSEKWELRLNKERLEVTNRSCSKLQRRTCISSVSSASIWPSCMMYWPL